MTPRRGRIRRAAFILVAAWLASAPSAGLAPPAAERGGRLVVALRSEPSTLNPTTPLRASDMAVIERLHGSLVAVDRETFEPLPALAESWEVAEDGHAIDLQLRKDVRFSDGEPFDSEDVVVTFEEILRPETASIYRASFVVGGEAVKVTATGTHSVRLEFGQPRAAAVRLLDGIGILPSHRVRPLIEAGKWASSWGVSTPPAEMAGLGPFRLARYEPGERLVMERNPHYWKRGPRGRPLPYLDRVEYVFVPKEAEEVRFAAGDTDVISSTADSFLALKRGGSDRVMTDAGPGLQYSCIFFNMNELGAGAAPDLAARQAWFRRREFRQAVSRALDREAISRVVYRGRALPLATHQSPAVGTWSHPDLRPHDRDLDAARALLRSAGFSWRGGRLVDTEGRDVRFSILVTASNASRRKVASLVQQDLEPVGIRVDVVPLDTSAVVQRVIETHDYDAVLLEVYPQDADPTAYVGVLVTGGGSHLWQMGDSPATEWERELDRLMREQAITVDRSRRRELYLRVQEVVAEELPFLPLVSPHVLVGTRARLRGVRPPVIGNDLLWNAEHLYWESPGSR